MRNLNSDAKASFCQQVDDWMLLKITEKIIRRMFLKKEKEFRVKHQSAFEQLRPVTHASKTKCSIYTPDALWPMSPPITST